MTPIEENGFKVRGTYEIIKCSRADLTEYPVGDSVMILRDDGDEIPRVVNTRTCEEGFLHIDRLDHIKEESPKLVTLSIEKVGEIASVKIEGVLTEAHMAAILAALYK
jgi:hypothetical protein